MNRSRRTFLASAGAAAVAAPGLLKAEPYVPEPEFRPQWVEVKPGLTPGEIHVDTQNHFVYLIGENDTGLRYGCAVGEQGRGLEGRSVIGRKAEWPSWTPTQNMIDREPETYAQYADGMPGGPENPLGSRALYLYRDGRDTLYRIHGTPQPWTIGTSASSGCIRMINAHVEDLYTRVPVGTAVEIYMT